MSSPKTKKQATKGSKQIVEDNKATIKFFRNMSIGGFLIYALIAFIIGSEYTSGSIIMICLATAIYLTCYKLLTYAAKASYSGDGKILDSGTDLNMEGGIAEHVKDMVILTTIAQLLSLVSFYFWNLLLLAPARAFFILWKSVLAPWFFQPSPQQEVDEKKQRKHDKRQQQQQ